MKAQRRGLGVLLVRAIKGCHVFTFENEGVLLQEPLRLSYEVRSATVAVAT